MSLLLQIENFCEKYQKLPINNDFFNVIICTLYIMAIRVVEFSIGGTKLERFLPKNQHTQRKLLNFENWVNGKVSKIGHHFSK